MCRYHTFLIANNLTTYSHRKYKWVPEIPSPYRFTLPKNDDQHPRMSRLRALKVLLFGKTRGSFFNVQRGSTIKVHPVDPRTGEHYQELPNKVPAKLDERPEQESIVVSDNARDKLESRVTMRKEPSELAENP